MATKLTPEERALMDAALRRKRAWKALEEQADLGKAMRAAQRLTKGGRVVLTLDELGEFRAQAFHEFHAAQDLGRQRLLAKGGGSVTLEQVTEAMNATTREPIAQGTGKTPADALLALRQALAQALGED